MPYMLRVEPCKQCGEGNKPTRLKWHKENQKYYLQSKCRDCEQAEFREYQKKHLNYFREANKQSYLKLVGEYKHILNRTPEDRAQRARDKANRRCTRAKMARVNWDKEFTDFVYKEAHELRKQRNTLTGIEWHVDHNIPLNGDNVCGLHVWNNFAVIPKVENLRKRNYHSVHD